MKIEALIKEIEGMKSTLLLMESRIEELEAAPSTGLRHSSGQDSGRTVPTLSDAEKVLFIREAVRRDMRGDGSMRKAYNRHNAPRPPLNLRGGDKPLEGGV